MEIIGNPKWIWMDGWINFWKFHRSILDPKKEKIRQSINLALIWLRRERQRRQQRQQGARSGQGRVQLLLTHAQHLHFTLCPDPRWKIIMSARQTDRQTDGHNILPSIKVEHADDDV